MIPLFSVTGFFYRYASDFSNEKVKAKISAEVDIANRSLQRLLDESATNIRFWRNESHTRLALEFRRAEGLQGFLNDLVRGYKEYLGIIVLSKTGQVFAANTVDKDGKALDPNIFKSYLEKIHEADPQGRLLFLVENQIQAVFVQDVVSEEGKNLGKIITIVDPIRLQSVQDQLMTSIRRLPFVEATPYTFIDFRPENAVGQVCSDMTQNPIQLCVKFIKKPIGLFQNQIGVSLILLSIGLFFVSFLFFNRLIGKTLDPLRMTLDAFGKISRGEFRKVKFESSYPELLNLESATNTIINRMRDYSIQIEKGTRLLAMAETGRAVSHDIKSPLAALDVALKNISALPPQVQTLIQAAVKRLHEILKDLDDRVRSLSGDPTTRQPRSKIYLPPLIQSMIHEKDLEYFETPNIKIELLMDPKTPIPFIEANPAQMRRLISNLINNSIESYPPNSEIKRISIELSSASHQLIVNIRDYGKGIEPENLQRVTEKGVSIGKQSGSGMGLYQASQWVKDWGGALHIHSKVGEGTTVSMTFLTISTPSWFVPHLTVSEYPKIFVVDDDPSIHQFWNLRLAQLPRCPQILFFHSPEDFLQSVSKDQPHPTSKPLALVDYEFFNSDKSGLDIWNDTHEVVDFALVTSHAESLEIQTFCEMNRVRLIAKHYAQELPIQ